MKTALVTGASGNLGKAIVKKFIDEGYFVSGTVIQGDETPFNFPPDKFEKIVVDLMDESEAQQMIDNIITKHGKTDAAILTVGGFAMGSIGETNTSDIEKQYKLNFETAYNTARPVFIQMMKQNNGRIFIIGSKPGLSANYGKGMLAYSLAKSLLFRLAELMNDEAKGNNVVTAVVVPSTIDTLPNRESMPDANFDNWVKPDAIAAVIHWYCSEDATVLRETVIKVYNNA